VIALPPGFLGGEALRQLQFSGPGTGFLLGTRGRLFATSDGGKRWSELLALGHQAIQSVAFTSPRNGWAAEGDADGTPGEVLRTSDGGRSWRPQIDELGAGGHEGYALDGAGHLFVTNSAGDLGGVSGISLKAPRRALKHGRVTVTRRLFPALSGASVEVNHRAVAGGSWVHDFVITGAGGRFSLQLRIDRPTAFVAQWGGDLTSAGAGSGVVSVEAAAV